MIINSEFLTRCIGTLQSAAIELQRRGPPDSFYDILRAAAVKELEIILEQNGSLPKKHLRPYFASNRAADRLTYKDTFRHAANFGPLTTEARDRWVRYRDNVNDNVHNCAEGFAESTLKLLPEFIGDAKRLACALDESNDD